MTNLAKSSKPSHSDVVHHLLDNLDKLGIKRVKREGYLTEVRMCLGQDLEGFIDLVTIGGYRVRGNKRGTTLVLYKVKTDTSGLFRVIFRALQQVSMYQLALRNPLLYVKEEDKIEKLSNSLAYKKYLVIQKALWEEERGFSDEEKERLGELIVLSEVGIITYDDRWKFREEREYGYPKEEPTEYLGKTVRKKKLEKK